MSDLELEQALAQLVEEGLVEVEVDEEGGRRYRLTEEGCAEAEQVIRDLVEAPEEEKS